MFTLSNVPANLILFLDPRSVDISQSQPNVTNPRASLYTSLHLPCYILAWLSSIVKACTANFRASFRDMIEKKMLR